MIHILTKYILNKSGKRTARAVAIACSIEQATTINLIAFQNGIESAQDLIDFFCH